MLRKLTYALFLSMILQHVRAQEVVYVDTLVKDHIFSHLQIYCFEDKLNKLTIDDVSSDYYTKAFQPNHSFYPVVNNHLYSYWYKVKIRFKGKISAQPPLFEFFDQTTDKITAYIPDSNGKFIESKAGAAFKFQQRLFNHKNFEFLITNQSSGEHTYYFKVSSKQAVNVIIVYRTTPFFIHYALTEYFTFGIFYGMILIFCLHNLLMFVAVKQRQYLYYVLYILSIGLFEMNTDGIAFQYLWPGSPEWNEYAYGIALYFVSVFALIFTKELLHVKIKAPKLNLVINWLIVLRTVYFLICLTLNNNLFYYKFLEIIPLSVAFFTGISIWQKGYKPARFFVVGYTFLFIGFLFKTITVLGYNRYFPGFVRHYSLGYSFIIEMVFLSFAIGDQIRILRKQKDVAQEAEMRQIRINSELKDNINQELESQVAIRTTEVINKSDQIFRQAQVIEKQNETLLTTNKLLELQAEEISRMNVLLERDNSQLKDNIEKVTDARALSKELSFDEFSAKYPNQEKCNKLLAEIKWAKGFSCIKCSNTTYSGGRTPYSRRCSKCGYEESPLLNTIFQNSRIPINKAFYMVYLIYTSNGTISSYLLAEKLEIRQSTCWQYAIKIKKVLEEKKKDKKSNLGWMKIIIS